MELFAHPFSSYSWKALIALWEKEVAFEYRSVDVPDNHARMVALWPFGKFPVLVDGDRVIGEASAIIEYLETIAPAPPLLTGDTVEVRQLDRIFDNHVMSPVQAIVTEHIHRPGAHRRDVIDEAERRLDLSYAWLDARLAGRLWAAGDGFTLADCAGAPSLFYADWVRPIPSELTTLKDYRARLLARPSVTRAVEEARPHRALFPPGAPDRD